MRLIDADALIDRIKNPYEQAQVARWVNEQPTIEPEKHTQERTETHACDLIDREAAVDAIYHHLPSVSRMEVRLMLHEVPSAQPEQPLYVAEIEAEYQKAVKMPHIHKPLAKALYEVWKKHDREDAERRTDDYV